MAKLMVVRADTVTDRVTPEQLRLWPRRTSPHPLPSHSVSHSRGRFSPVDVESLKAASLVLASGSPSRVRILKSLRLRFSATASRVDESSVASADPTELVIGLSSLKAKAAATSFTDSLVLGADTLISDEHGVIGKPVDQSDAKIILRRLSGKSHEVISGLTLIDQRHGQMITRSCTTRVVFRSLSDRTISRYVETGEPLGKAGAYALQGAGAILVGEVRGEYTNVLGLPVSTLLDLLSEGGYFLL
jgi:septum formation protein